MASTPFLRLFLRLSAPAGHQMRSRIPHRLHGRYTVHGFLKRFLTGAVVALSFLGGGGAFAGVTAEGKWTYDPAKEGMADLRAMLPIEGCNVPGGLQRISDRDEPSSVPFWCGTPPHCLNVGLAYADSCVFIKHCRRDPRYDPNGAPGANGCRDPEDLICVGSGAHPEGGHCLQTCWDGSRIPFSQACPPSPTPSSPPPTPQPRSAAPIEYCPDGSVKNGSTCPEQPLVCSDGSIMGPSGCPQYCPDGKLMPPGGCPAETPKIPPTTTPITPLPTTKVPRVCYVIRGYCATVYTSPHTDSCDIVVDFGYTDPNGCTGIGP